MDYAIGEMIDRPRFQDAAIEKIKFLQRVVSRKKKDSKNRRKAVILLKNAWRKVTLQREDYCQKVTTDLARRFQTLVFEKLKISNMVKRSNLAYQIYDACWYKLRHLADYKSEVVLIEPAYTTQQCSHCGKIPEQKISLDIRIYKCDGCGFIIDRDQNAAININKAGSERTLVEKLPLPVRQATSMKQEAQRL